jgi:hypothetical protein
VLCTIQSLSIGHPPPAQDPEGQLPMLHASAFPAETAALKLENCFFTRFAPQAGHAGGGPSVRRRSFSKAIPHFSHWYS